MGARLVQKSVEVAVRPDGSLLLAAIADTHSRPHPALAAHLAALEPDAILHAGDVGGPAALGDLSAIAPVHAVRGNIDAHDPALPDVLTIDLVRDGQLKVRVLLLHVGLAGPRLRADAAKRAHAAKATLVVCGHSHVPFLAQERGLTVFNPGSCGPRRFHLPIVFGAIELTPTAVRLRHLDCETGRPWSPP